MSSGGSFNYPLQDDGETSYTSAAIGANHMPRDDAEPEGIDFNAPPLEFDEPGGKPGYAVNMDYRQRRDAIDGKIMISTIIALLLVVWLVFFLYVYARWFWRQSARVSGRNRQRSASTRHRFHFTGEEPARLRNVGLDAAVLETLPMFVYKSQNFTDGLECAVCLSEFEEDEKARLLPNCRHSFHADCIDMWFRSHSTCPLCRTEAQPEQPVLESIGIGQLSATIPGSIPSGITDNWNSEQRHTASSGEDYNVQNPTNIFSSDQQKQMNADIDQGTSGGRRELIMPHIGIEIPAKGPDGFSSPGEASQLHSPNDSQSFSKSPVARLRSLVRMFSRDSERKAFPSDHPAEV